MYIDSPKGCGRERKEVGPFVRQIVRREERGDNKNSSLVTRPPIQSNPILLASHPLPSLFPAQHHPLDLADLWSVAPKEDVKIRSYNEFAASSIRVRTKNDSLLKG